MRVEDKGEYWEVDGYGWVINKIGLIYCAIGKNYPPFIYDLRDSLMEELEEVNDSDYR